VTAPRQPLGAAVKGRFRDECLNTHWFLSLEDARAKIEAWRRDFYEARPHTSLGFRTPADEAPDLAVGLDGVRGQAQGSSH